MNAPHPVVLLGSDCLTGLQIARILWRRGVPVVGVADRTDSAYGRGRAWTRIVALEKREDLVALLDELSTQYARRPLLLPCTDRHALWLSELRDAVAERGAMLLPEAETLDLLANKARFAQHALDHGLRFPETRIVDTLQDIARAGEEMTFPLVAKPPRRTPAWDRASGVEKVCRIDDPAALLRRGPALLSAAGSLVLQAWVAGPDSQSRELTVLMDGRGELLASVVLQKLRQWPPGTGTGSLAVEVTDEEVRAAGLAVLAPLDYAGLGQIEFKRDARDGELYLIEMNPGRAALNQPLCEAAGVDMTFAWYCAAAGLPRPPHLAVRHPGAKWICWKRDLPSAFRGWRRGELTLAEWGRSLRGIRWSADVQLDDPWPMVADLWRKLVGLLLRRVER